MSFVHNESKDKILNTKKIYNSTQNKRKEHSFNKNTNKKLFSVNKNPERKEKKEEIKVDKIETKNNEGVNNSKNKLIEEKTKNINNINKLEEKKVSTGDDKNENKNNLEYNKNKEEEKNSKNNSEKATINNNYIINKDNSKECSKDNSNNNPFMLNSNLMNTNVINNNIKNFIGNNNTNNCNSNNNNSNVINNINYNYNNNFINDLQFKDNNINRDNNVEKNNIINNIRLMCGISIQPKFNRNTFLNRKHHLLENAIIKKQFQEPKRKVNLKKEINPSLNYIDNNSQYNSEYFHKIINLKESDSENYFDNDEDEENEISYEYEEESDEEYIINKKFENKISKSIKRKKGNINFISNISNYKQKEIDNFLFFEFNNLIKKYTFNIIIDYISKYYDNGLTLSTNQNQSSDYELIKKIIDLLSKSEKDLVILTLIQILSNNYKENQFKLMNLINKSKSLDKKENIKERSQNRVNPKLINNNINKIKEKRKHTKKPSPPFYYGKHFFKMNNRIYIYVPKAKTGSLNRYTLYCMYRAKDECMAKIVVNQNDNKISYIGNHICNPKMTLDDFYRKYPYVNKEPDWTHIQFAVEKEKTIILSRF